MNTQLRENLESHSKLAFTRMRMGKPLLRQFHRLPKAVQSDSTYKSIYRWLMVPYSLWPVDFIGIAQHLFFNSKASGRKLAPELVHLIEFIGEPPCEQTCATVSAHEHSIVSGDYESLIKAPHKFALKEDLLKQNPGFRADWQWLKDNFDLKRYRGRGGVIRRRMVSERSFRHPRWEFCWKTREDAFRNIFDAFCHKWDLYGMENDKPLLQKLTVNVTPFGTMVVIPKYWSLDGHRDFLWGVINRLHRSRVSSKQGVKLCLNQAARHDLGNRARQLFEEAAKLSLKGEARDDWLKSKLGLRPDTDRKDLWRLRRY